MDHGLTDWNVKGGMVLIKVDMAMVWEQDRLQDVAQQLEDHQD